MPTPTEPIHPANVPSLETPSEADDSVQNARDAMAAPERVTATSPALLTVVSHMTAGRRLDRSVVTSSATLNGLIEALRAHGAVLYVDDGEIMYGGPELPLECPLRTTLAEHRRELVDRSTHEPHGRCGADDRCSSPSEAHAVVCPEHGRSLAGSTGGAMSSAVTRADLLFSVSYGSSAETITKLFTVCFPDASTALDGSYGKGRFWDGTAPVDVTGVDIVPKRASHVVGDFTAMPFANESFDVVVLDPPFLSDTGRGKPSVMGTRFKSLGSVDAAREAIMQGCREAWRVARLGVIVKVQDHTHGNRLVQMTRWVEEAIPADLYDQLHLVSPHKIVDPKWKSPQLSIYHNASTFLVFRKDGPIHRRQRPAPLTIS